MNKLVIFTAILGCASAAPAYLLTHETHAVPVVHTISPSKTTITKNSQVVNHGGHEIVHVPVHSSVHLVHEPVVHQSIVHQPIVHEHVVHEVKHPAKSSQFFKLENTEYHAPKVVSSVPVVHAPIVQTHLVHAPISYAPVSHHISRSGDSAVSHQSTSVHETMHEVKHLPLYTLHH